MLWSILIDGAPVLFSFVVAVFTVATVLESRRQAQLQQANKRLEELYTPIHFALQQNNNQELFRPQEFDESPWDRVVEPRLERYMHLADEELQAAFIELSQSPAPLPGDADPLHEELDRLREVIEDEFIRLQTRTAQLTGRGGQVNAALSLLRDRP